MIRYIINSVNRTLLNPLGIELTSKRPKPALTMRHATRFLLFADMFQRLSDVEGCIVECGVASGRGTLYLSYLVKHEGKGRMIYGYDTFAGYPSVSERDQPKDKKFIPPQIGGLACKEHQTWRFLQDSDIGTDFLQNHVQFVKGDVTQTTRNFPFGKIALLITEMDLYSGSKAALENLLPHMAEGGIILPLNYIHAATKFPGGHEAVEEVFGEKVKAFHLHSQTGKKYYTHSIAS